MKTSDPQRTRAVQDERRAERFSEAYSKTSVRLLSVVLMLLCCIGCAMVVFSCNDGVITFTGGSARVHIFNAQVKTQSMDVDIDTVTRYTAMINGELSSDLSLSSGLYHSFFCHSTYDTTVNGHIANQRYILGDGASYTLVVRGSNITDFIQPVMDAPVSPFPGKAALRIINATDTISCNVKVDTNIVNTIIADVQTSSKLYPVNPGLNLVQIIDVYNNAIIDHLTFDFHAGTSYHLFVYDAPSGSSIIQKVKIIEVH